MSSTWRKYKDSRSAVIKNFDSIGLKHFIDWTPFNLEWDAQRGNEIQKWLDNNKEKYNIEKFIILDDDFDMAHLKDRLVQTTWEQGLTSEVTETAIQILFTNEVK